MICYVGLCYANPIGALVKTKRLVKSITFKWYQVVQSKHWPNMTQNKMPWFASGTATTSRFREITRYHHVLLKIMFFH